MKRDDPRLFRRQLQPKLSQSFAQYSVEALRIFFVLKRAHKIIRVPHQTRFPSTVFLDNLVKPQIKCIMQVYVGQNG